MGERSLGPASRQADAEPRSGLLESSLPSCTTRPRPSALSGDTAWCRQTPRGSDGSNVWKKLGEKIILCRRQKCQNQVPVQRVKDWQLRFSPQNISGLHKQWDGAGSKRGRSFQRAPGCSPETAQFGWFSKISAAYCSCRKFYTCALGQSPDGILRWEEGTCLLKAPPGEAGGRGGRGEELSQL